jgi:hypothetical protein
MLSCAEKRLGHNRLGFFTPTVHGLADFIPSALKVTEK